MPRRSLPAVAALLAVALAAVAGLVVARSERDVAERLPVVLGPVPNAPLPREPRALARDLAANRNALYRAIDRWRRAGDPTRGGSPPDVPARGGPPGDVTLLALHQQRIYRLAASSPRLGAGVVAALPPALRAEARDNIIAPRELGQIRSVRRGPPPRISVGPAQPAGVLLSHYRRAHRRFGVGPPLLAAVNFVESAFGRLRNRSVSGARGPMQFIDSTWEAYGLGGDVSDPADSIMGAANYLHANGAPADEREALYHYNPSDDYVRAISRYARRIRADERAFYAYYAYQVYVGDRRLTGPGLG